MKCSSVIRAHYTTNNPVAELTTELNDAIRQRDELRLELDALRLVLEFDVYCTSMGDSNVFAYAIFEERYSGLDELDLQLCEKHPSRQHARLFRQVP